MAKKGRTKKEEFHPTVLNADIIEDEILTRLPVKSLVRFRCVNKHWYALLTTNSTFIQKHLTRSIHINDENNNNFIIRSIQAKPSGLYLLLDGDLDKLVDLQLPPNLKKLRGSYISGPSNGLICIFDCDSYLFTCLWNPATRQQMILPSRGRMKRPKSYHSRSFGFGFHPIINDYKLVILFSYIQFAPTITEVEVYSLNTNSWKKLGVFPYRSLDFISKSILNGVVHWIASHRTSTSQADKKIILSFDLADEVFREIPLPDKMNPVGVGVAGMYPETFRGCLSLVVQYETRELDYWVMKEYNVKESWNKLFSVKLEILSTHPIQLLKNDDIVLRLYGHTFASFNLESRKLQRFDLRPKIGNSRIWDVHPFVESLVPVMTTNSRAGGRHAYGLRSLKKKTEVVEID